MINKYGNNILNLNCDSHEIYDVTPLNDGVRIWVCAGVANKILEYPDRREQITTDSLFSPPSINTLVGATLTKNHPPQAIKSTLNRKRYGVGTCLQEYVADGDRLLMSAYVYDQPTVDSILKGEITHASSGYYPIKELIDGIYFQTHREYNHLALLTQDSVPRAGSGCEVISFNPPTYEQEQLQNTDSGITPDQINNLISERVQLWTEWGNILKENNLAINYNFDSTQIKKKVLGLHYDGDIVDKIDDSNIDGFWLSFVSQNNSISQNTDSVNNFKTDKPNHRDLLIKSLEGRI